MPFVPVSRYSTADRPKKVNEDRSHASCSVQFALFAGPALFFYTFLVCTPKQSYLKRNGCVQGITSVDCQLPHVRIRSRVLANAWSLSVVRLFASLQGVNFRLFSLKVTSDDGIGSLAIQTKPQPLPIRSLTSTISPNRSAAAIDDRDLAERKKMSSHHQQSTHNMSNREEMAWYSNVNVIFTTSSSSEKSIFPRSAAVCIK